MNTNFFRIGNITSSEIVAIMSNGKTKGTVGAPALEYINERNLERKLGRSLNTESDARPLVWGKAIESRVFELLGLEYQLVSKETIVNPEIPYHSGSPDAIKKDTVIDIKAPNTLKSFCNLVDPLYKELKGINAMNEIRDNHKDGDKFYWQLVSNAILTNSKYAELIVYVPYLSELMAIRDHARHVYWIANATDEELPYLPDGGYFKNLNVIRFEVPECDKESLIERIKLCGNLLINKQTLIEAI